MGDFLTQLLGGIFAGLIVLVSYVYFNSDLDKHKFIKEFDNEDAKSDFWYDKPTYAVSYTFTIMLLIAIVVFYELRW